jgi:hypothetical protein
MVAELEDPYILVHEKKLSLLQAGLSLACCRRRGRGPRCAGPGYSFSLNLIR